MKMKYEAFIHYIRSLNYSKFIDYGVVFLGLTLILFGSYSIYFYESEDYNAGNLEAIASVERVQLKPKRKINGSISWNKIVEGQTLYRGDYVVTDETSEVNVKFNNNSKLIIPSSSLVKIDYVGDSISLEIVKGLVSLDLKGTDGKVFLKKNGKNYQVDGTNGKVEINGEGDTLKFASEKKSIQVSEVNQDGSLKTLEIARKLVKFIFPNGNVIDPIKERSTIVKIQGVEPQKRYLVELIDKKKRVIERYKENGERLEKGLRFNFASIGIYQVKLSTIKKDFLKSASFKVKDYPVIVFDPSAIVPVRKVPGGEQVKFPWKAIQNMSYEVQIERDGKVFRRRLDYPHFSLKAEEAFDVRFRVRINHGDAPWTKWYAQSLALDSVYVKNDELTKDVVFLDAPKKERVLAISNDFEGKRRFEIAKDKSFSQLVYKRETDGKNVVVPRKLLPGKYFWRVVNVNQDFKRTPVYPVRMTSYVVFPKRKGIYLEKLGNVSLPWRERLRGGKYEVIIKNKKKEEIARIDTEGRFANLPIKSFGKYFLTINPKTSEDILVSRIDFPFEVRKKSFPAPFVAKDIMLKRSHKAGLSKHFIELPKFDKDKYEKIIVEIYKNKNDTKPIYTGSSKSRYHVWKTRRSGKYFYKLRAVAKSGKLTAYTDTKELLFPISPFFVTAVRVPAGKKQYYRFSYLVKRGDNLATILRNYTKANTVLSNKSPMVQQIIKRNKHVSDWENLQAGKKIDVFVAKDALDKSFLFIYKKLFIVKG